MKHLRPVRIHSASVGIDSTPKAHHNFVHPEQRAQGAWSGLICSYKGTRCAFAVTPVPVQGWKAKCAGPAATGMAPPHTPLYPTGAVREESLAWSRS